MFESILLTLANLNFNKSKFPITLRREFKYHIIDNIVLNFVIESFY